MQRLVSFSMLCDEMEKSSLLYQLLMKMYSVFSFYKSIYQGYKWRIDVGSGHGVNTWFSTSLSLKNKLLSSIPRILESTSTHLPPLILLWWSGKHFPKRVKLEQFPQTHRACLNPPYQISAEADVLSFLTLCRRQRRCKIKTNRVWSVAEHSSSAAGAMPHRSCAARTRAPDNDAFPSDSRPKLVLAEFEIV